eukprot:NODE_305_length_11349_cov_0.358222.p10 type:complete len:135 gc:universal NODE_305_length_11349_cov_0.358222:2957-3361(+)
MSRIFDVEPPKSESENELHPDIVYRDSFGKRIKNEPAQSLNMHVANTEATHQETKLAMSDKLKKELRIQDPMYHQLKETSRIPIWTEDFPKNRFDITPGYRWDGIDRSNGFEERYLEVHTELKEISNFDDLCSD